MLLSDSLHQLFLDRKDLRLVLSFDSLEIFCFSCDLEILDEHITRQFGSAEKLVVHARQELLAIVRDFSFAKYSRPWSAGIETLDLVDWHRQFKIHLLNNSTISNSFNAVVYLLWSIPYIRYVRSSQPDPKAGLHPRARESAPQRHPPHLHVAAPHSASSSRSAESFSTSTTPGSSSSTS